MTYIQLYLVYIPLGIVELFTLECQVEVLIIHLGLGYIIEKGVGYTLMEIT